MLELINVNMYHFLMVFLRIGSALMLMPGFMGSYINTQVRLSAALAVAVVMMPVVTPYLPVPPADIPPGKPGGSTLIAAAFCVSHILYAFVPIWYKGVFLCADLTASLRRVLSFPISSL